MNNTNLYTSEIKNSLWILPGSVMIAAGVAFFLLPAAIATGGTPGLGMLIHFLSGISTGTAMLLVNIPLLLSGIRMISARFALRTIASMLITAISVDLMTEYCQFPPIQSMLLSTLYGGIVVGAGVGMVLRGNASAGGTTIIAKIISSYFNISAAQVILIVDLMIIVAIGFIFADMERVLWSMLSIYATTKVIDNILTGGPSEKIVHIVSQKADEIGNAIESELGRDGSILSGKNLTRQKEKTLLFVVINGRTIPQLKSLILGIDPEALMIVMQANEILGTSRQLQTS